MKEITFGLTGLQEAAAEFLSAKGNGSIFVFEGEMGAGKTTFISELCRQLGAEDDFGSPTFSIVNEYLDSSGSPIYHFDFYRIENPQEALDMGVEEYFNSGDLCLIEWPDRLGTLLPQDATIVKIRVNDDDTRTILF